MASLRTERRRCKIFKAAMACAVLAWLPTGPVPAEESQAASPGELIMYSNDYAELLEEYWPRISLGDVDAMVVSFEAMNICANFKDAISASETLDDFDEAMAGQHPGMIEFGRGIFYKCKRLVERFDWYPGWEQLRLRAALAGDPLSRVMLVSDYYRYRKERPREDFPYSPAEFVIEALDERSPEMLNFIQVRDAPWGLREENGAVIETAWGLVFCHYYGKCETSESMARFCAMMTPECAHFDNALEMITSEAGGDENLAAAYEKADTLIAAIEQRRYGDLGLVIDY